MGDAPHAQRMRRRQSRAAAVHGGMSRMKWSIGDSLGGKGGDCDADFSHAARSSAGSREVAKRPVVHRQNAVSRAKTGGFRHFPRESPPWWTTVSDAPKRGQRLPALVE
jgi:hypothetical protein